MTIKTRNRITFGFFIFASLIFLAELSLFIIQLLKGDVQVPEVTFSKPGSQFFLFNYNPAYVILGIFLKNIYICFTTLIVWRSFSKTQTTEIFYFAMFLLACLCDSIRILTILFHISYTYSTSLLIIGNVDLFARIMIPLSLAGVVILNEESHRQNIERNSLLFIVVATFLATFIPLNTSIIEPNFTVSYGYEKTIFIFTMVIHAANILTLIVRNIKQNRKQASTIGYVLLTVGYLLMFNSYSIFNLVMGFLCLSSGTALFMRALHKYFLWND